ncbi:MAG: hypothetical protein HYR90_00200 [Candidatus Andersenbacteria bacterium]|nr:hypothetical protein [Candidatus Andersenbacteria bacterium]MBI3250661.1 hypothetical protein [Candidatus Andersenbacteria bacterium]
MERYLNTALVVCVCLVVSGCGDSKKSYATKEEVSKVVSDKFTEYDLRNIKPRFEALESNATNTTRLLREINGKLDGRNSQVLAEWPRTSVSNQPQQPDAADRMIERMTAVKEYQMKKEADAALLIPLATVLAPKQATGGPSPDVVALQQQIAGLLQQQSADRAAQTAATAAENEKLRKQLELKDWAERSRLQESVRTYQQAYIDDCRRKTYLVTDPTLRYMFDCKHANHSWRGELTYPSFGGVP